MFNHRSNKLLLLISAFLFFSCNKLVEIPDPKNSLTTDRVFNNDTQATGAMAGILTQMINTDANSSFASGLTSITARASADEINLAFLNTDIGDLARNSLTAESGFANGIWSSAYQAIYGANSVMEGIEASKSVLLRAQTRTQLNAEAKFIRAFSYFYLVNCFGDVPLLLSTNLAENANKPRTAAAVVYQQIVNDLIDAVNGLPADYSAGGGERIRANKWAAKALLARVYLYTGDNSKAIQEATDVIGQTGLYQLETADLNKVFLKNSSETIWQLQQNEKKDFTGNAVPEAVYMLPSPLHTGVSGDLSSYLLKAFEPGDLRKAAWIDSADFSQGGVNYHARFIYKYKTGRHNLVIGGAVTEYYMVLRFAEMYLIRGEAFALSGQLSAGIEDLNVLRRRAAIAPLPTTLTKDQTLAAIAKERQTELFGEWGHRWFDLKRTGKAEQVLSAIPAKQPWRGNYQLLYPIPKTELQRDHFLTQNPNY
jgi:hypothetical protein